MLTFDAFVNKYIGKKTDYDNYADEQCVDLIKIYLKECFGIKAGSWGNAVDYFRRANDPKWAGYEAMHKYFILIKNTASFKPLEGDIVVYGEKFSKKHDYGHIGIDSGESTLNTVVMYDQNATGNNDPMKKSSYFGYVTRNCLGVWRPKDRSFITDGKVCFKACDKSYTSLVDALRSVGARSDFAYRKVIASKNGISGYIGSAKQNTAMLNLLKKGKLIKP